MRVTAKGRTQGPSRQYHLSQPRGHLTAVHRRLATASVGTRYATCVYAAGPRGCTNHSQADGSHRVLSKRSQTPETPRTHTRHFIDTKFKAWPDRPMVPGIELCIAPCSPRHAAHAHRTQHTPTSRSTQHRPTAHSTRLQSCALLLAARGTQNRPKHSAHAHGMEHTPRS